MAVIRAAVSCRVTDACTPSAPDAYYMNWLLLPEPSSCPFYARSRISVTSLG